MPDANITGTATEVRINDADLKIMDSTKDLIAYGNAAIMNTATTATLTVGSKVIIDEYDTNTLVVRGKAVIDDFELTGDISAVNATFSGKMTSASSNVTGVSNVGSFVSVGDATIGGVTTISNTLTVSKATTLSNTLAVTGSTTLSDTLGVSGATTLSDTLGVSGATTLSNTLSVSEATTLSNTLEVSDATTLLSTLGVTGATTLSSTLAVTGAATLSGGVNSGLTVNSGDLTVSSGDVSVSGNLYIGGTTTTVNTENLLVKDPIIVVGNAAAAGSITDVGFILTRETGSNVAVYVENDSGPKLTFGLTNADGTSSSIETVEGASLPVSIEGTLVTSGNVTVGSDTMFVNVSNGRVGVGTTTPEVELQVNGDAKVTNIEVTKITFT